MQWTIRVLLASFVLFAFAGAAQEQALAEPAPPAAGKAMTKSGAVPDTITLDTRQGKVALPHLAHAKRLHCAICHSEIKPGQRAWDSTTVHSYCRDCHQTEGRGPATCGACHQQ